MYKLRGIADGVFGALEVRYGASIRARKEQTRRIAALMLAAAFNISASQRAVAMLLAEVKGMKAQKVYLHVACKTPCVSVGIRKGRLVGKVFKQSL